MNIRIVSVKQESAATCTDGSCLLSRKQLQAANTIPGASSLSVPLAAAQVFNCVYQAEEGGASTYIDGFAVAERLRLESPAAFDFFSRTSLSYHCFDEGCHYVAEGPVFRLGDFGRVVQVNQLPVRAR